MKFMAIAWWVRHKKRLGYELNKLKEAGYSYSLQKEWFVNGGNGLIHLKKESGAHAGLELKVFFPDTYPYFRFEIVAPGLKLKFHQNHITKGLCLLGRAPENWSSEDTVAGVLTEKLSYVIQSGRSDDADEVAHLEDDQAEPFSEMYEYLPNFIILNDSSIEIHEDIKHGTMLIALKGSIEKGFTGIILEFHDEKGKTIARANPLLVENHGNILDFKHTIEARWIRTPQPIEIFDPVSFYKKVCEYLPPKKPHLRNQKFMGSVVEIHGVCFPEEISRRKKGWGWTYCMRASKIKGNKRIKTQRVMIRPGYIGHEDIMARTSFLAGMKNKTVALFGLGCLGAPSAIELAKCGLGRLHIVDFDYVDPGTLPRWPLGLSAVGKSKSNVIASLIEANYPYTKIDFKEPIRLGEVSFRQNKKINDYDILENLLNNVDLVYDASADLNIQHLLSCLTREKNIPYIALDTTPGIWGGQICRIIPNKTDGCWDCVNYHQKDFREGNFIETTAIPIPLSDMSETGLIQPKGCGSPTYTGAVFDANEISNCGVRLAVSTLTEGEKNSYSVMNWDVAIVNLRNEDGSATIPKWQTYKLNPHPRCPCQS